ncbi:caffeine-induced death protein 2-domain-containing protein [Phanerochaete sordida]|uniref:Caffeine-induced death protein 2-domain-containing protein n=1 Tax=Phanerochaete sordida TaxID=48140 RepID=A0A9P3FXN8_9APHY|nr:caffeine-induced death protein 2-domain-containing protein [Phanerochaete sordida]
MSPKLPALGSLAVQAPSLNPQTVHVSPSTCQNLSAFKDLMNQYRKLDDSITMRLNRANAQFRDLEREGTVRGTVQDEACAYIWRDLVENWKRRTDIIQYCVDAVDQSMAEKRKQLEVPDADPAQQRKLQGALYAEEVKRNQVHNELSVEKIVRNRSLDAFRTRCRYFEPPLTDADARKWWEAAQAGR